MTGAVITKGGKAIDLASLCKDAQKGSDAFSEYQRHIEAMDKIHRLVCVRERNRKEIRERLLSSGFTPSETREAIESAVRCGLIDETRYTEAFMRGKANSKWGRARIVNRLREDGIDDATIAQCSSYLPTEDVEYENAMRVLASKRATSKDPRATYMRRLLNRGFSMNLSLRAVDDFLSR